MRLWHQQLIPKLPRQQLLGQHRECCALRGGGWGKSHSVVNYVFDRPISFLVAYHFLVIDEMERRGYKVEPLWKDSRYRGKSTPPLEDKYLEPDTMIDFLLTVLNLLYKAQKGKSIYPEHDSTYLKECLENLRDKGINIELED